MTGCRSGKGQRSLKDAGLESLRCRSSQRVGVELLLVAIHAAAAAQHRFAVAEDIPGNTDARREVNHVRRVDRVGHTRFQASPGYTGHVKAAAVPGVTAALLRVEAGREGGHAVVMPVSPRDQGAQCGLPGSE